MARIFITGSADGLGMLAARELVGQGHNVVLHARNLQRADDAMKKVPGAENVLTADLSDPEQTRDLADLANRSGAFDAVIHNAGAYIAPAEQIFAVNVLAPYILTCLIKRPKRLIYLSSSMHLGGRMNQENFDQTAGRATYSDSKLYVLMLSMAIARKWKNVYSNAVDPGWVPTRMGGPGAPDDLQKGFETQVWLAVSEDQQAKVSGKYFYHQRAKTYHTAADDELLQERYLHLCRKITGLGLPR